jgi:hypothetical protein
MSSGRVAQVVGRQHDHIPVHAGRRERRGFAACRKTRLAESLTNGYGESDCRQVARQRALREEPFCPTQRLPSAARQKRTISAFRNTHDASRHPVPCAPADRHLPRSGGPSTPSDLMPNGDSFAAGSQPMRGHAVWLPGRQHPARRFSRDRRSHLRALPATVRLGGIRHGWSGWRCACPGSEGDMRGGRGIGRWARQGDHRR